MKRDLELIRVLLLEVEGKATIQPQKLNAPGFSPDQVDYHVDLLIDAGYLNGYRMAGGTLPTVLTWVGHEFLDATRNDTIWQKVKTTLKDRGIEAPLSVIQQLATQIVAGMLGLS